MSFSPIPPGCAGSRTGGFRNGGSANNLAGILGNSPAGGLSPGPGGMLSPPVMLYSPLGR